MVLFCLPAFLPCAIASFFTQNKGGTLPPGPFLDPPLSFEFTEAVNQTFTELTVEA